MRTEVRQEPYPEPASSTDIPGYDASHELCGDNNIIVFMTFLIPSEPGSSSVFLSRERSSCDPIASAPLRVTLPDGQDHSHLAERPLVLHDWFPILRVSFTSHGGFLIWLVSCWDPDCSSTRD